MPPLHVLLVEDHAPLREQVAAALRGAGHRVSEAADGRLALQQALDELPDVLVLDLGLPGLDGLQVCARLRAQAAHHVPVLMLTARDALPDKLQGFAAGSDDYLVKPFAAAELLARVQALAMRRGAGQDYLLRLGPLALDRRAGQAWRDDQALTLPPTPLAILRLLMEAHPRALTRSELIRRLWDDDPPDSDPLRSHIHSLRAVLDRPFATALLKTVHGLGFRLDLP
ncbi:response regulator transcription factor [Inhella proteolytica]|uniref:Response regulator transcription factor n=1 Tax=Inhella proteolytica TaxID=2795029 RepID=A0A931J644_9BURK|nr:response regulator transcription factor [Inhella proteolytica]MBH9576870.1 response regulator transcription factor [Inhella proteolytica]